MPDAEYHLWRAVHLAGGTESWPDFVQRRWLARLAAEVDAEMHLSPADYVAAVGWAVGLAAACCGMGEVVAWLVV